MSLYNNLIKTYDNCSSEIGKELLSLFYSIQKSHIVISLNKDGKFLRSEINIQKIMIPSTEASAMRTKGFAPHPLFDSMQYLDKNFDKHCLDGDKEAYEEYIKLLSDFCEFSGNKTALIIKKYIKGGTIFKDLSKNKCIFLDNNGKLGDLKSLPKEVNDKKFEKKQRKLSIRFKIISKGILDSEVWNDKSLRDDWIKYYWDWADKNNKKGLCMISGKTTILALNHPKFITNDGDGRKLISSNDGKNFTFRGDYFGLNKSSAAYNSFSIGLEESQKIHHALRYIIKKQGFSSGDMTWAAWTPKKPGNKKIISDIVNSFKDNNEEDKIAYTAEEFGNKMRKKILGIQQDLSDLDEICVVGLDGSQKGRLSIVFYEETDAKSFVDRIEKWFETSMNPFFFYNEKTKQYEITYKSPSHFEIAYMLVERENGNKKENIKNNIIKTLIRSIINPQQGIPKHIYMNAYSEVLSVLSSDKENKRANKNRFAGIFCSIMNIFNKRRMDMGLESNLSRDFLWGRALAIADDFEAYMLFLKNITRPTKATLLFQRFSYTPATSWQSIVTALKSVYGSDSKCLKYFKTAENKFAEIISKLDLSDNSSLSPEFVSGFYSQKIELLLEHKNKKGGNTTP